MWLCRSILLFVLIFFRFPAFAEEGSKQSVSLEDLKAYALLHSAQVKRIDSSLSTRLAEAFQTRTLQNPELEVSSHIPASYDGDRPKTELEVSLSQPLRISDFGVRSRVSDLLEKHASKEKQLELVKFLQEVSLAYYRLWALETHEIYLTEQLSRGKRLVKLVSGDSATGRFSVAQVHSTKASVAKLQAELLGMEHAQANASARLLRLTTYDISGRTLSKPSLPELPLFPEFFQQLSNSSNSLVKRYQLRAELAKEQYRLAKKDAYPSIHPQLTYSRNEEGVDFVGVGISIPLPFFQRNQGNIQRGVSRSAEARRLLSYVQSDAFRAEVRLLHSGAEVKQKQALTYEEKVIPPLRSALQSGEAAFQAGQLSILELWTIFSDYHEAVVQALELQVEAYSALTELSLLSGKTDFSKGEM